MTRSFLHNAIVVLPFLAVVANASGGFPFRHPHHHSHARHADEEAQSGHLYKRAPPARSGYTLTWSDDFTGSAGSLPSSSNWIFDVGTKYSNANAPDNWGTGEIQTYTTSTNNIRVDGAGILNIIPLKSSSGSWTSARIETKNTFVAAAGGKLRLEARIRIPNSASSTQMGIWPAFWAMGKAFRDGNNYGWPATGELDILEAVNGVGTVYNVIHCDVYPGGVCDEPNGISTTGSFTRGNYHTFGITIDRTASAWQSQSLTWEVDGVPTFKVLGSRVNNFSVWQSLAHRPMFMLLNVAVGGALPNAVSNGVWTPTEDTVGGIDSAMFVDYVAAYNSVPPTTTTTPTPTTPTSGAGTPSPVGSGTIPGCVKWRYAQGDDNCANLLTRFASLQLTMPLLLTYNPSMGTTASNCKVTLRTYYCVQADPPASATPVPVQAGVTKGCVKWRYAQGSDNCANLVTRFASVGLTLPLLVTYNPSLGTADNCRVTLRNYLCVQAAPVLVPTPTPVAARTIANCGQWRQIASGETCAGIVSSFASINLSMANLLAWNPTLGTTAANCRLTARNYVCVKINPPRPVQARQVTGCESWRYVQPTDTCANIVSRFASSGLTLANLVRWNPSLGTTSSCRVIPRYYVCIKP